MLKKLLEHPLTRGLEPDDPRTTEFRRRIIKKKALLRKIYEEWYRGLISAIPPPTACPGRVLELGAGGGFLKELLPDSITSEVFPCSGADVVLDARALPFAGNSLRAILMVDVLHHIPDVESFLREAQRTLSPGGIIAMWEPWNTSWIRLIYKKLHPEPFAPESEDWGFPPAGPLSGANGALPWIVFARDKERFARTFADLELERLILDYPFSYLLSGGVSLRALFPGIGFKPIRALERMLTPLQSKLAMFAFICLRKKETQYV